MRIFYGVQGTGNGHITRARAMAKELYAAGIEVDFQFSGRAFDQYFDMAIFKNYQLKQGLSFASNRGKVSYVKTALSNNPITFVKEVNALDLSAYDMVITDFEPVTAWAAKIRGIPMLGLGHQYAFKHKIPKQGSDPIADFVIQNFAPANRWIGVHWHHFGQLILPPIIQRHASLNHIKKKIVVYLPFEDTQEVMRCLVSLTDYHFHIYTKAAALSTADHLICKPLSRENFQEDLANCEGVISNAGFELAAEALQLGKKILVKPLSSQMEQISNAAALHQLGYGHTMEKLDSFAVAHWLHDNHAVKIDYPNVANILVNWLLKGMPDMTTDYVEAIWNTVDVTHINH